MRRERDQKSGNRRRSRRGTRRKTDQFRRGEVSVRGPSRRIVDSSLEDGLEDVVGDGGGEV